MEDVVYISKIENDKNLTMLAKKMLVRQSKLVYKMTYFGDYIDKVEVNNTTVDFFNVGRPNAELKMKFRFNNGLTLSVIWLEGLSYGCEQGLFEIWFWMDDEAKESDEFKEEYSEPLGYQTINDVVKEVKRCLKLIS